MVEMVKVDDTMGKKPDEYLVRGLDYNRQTKFGLRKPTQNQIRTRDGYFQRWCISRFIGISLIRAGSLFSIR